MRQLFLIVLILLPASLTAQPMLTPEKIDILRAGEEALLNARWTEAYETYRTLCAEDGGDPLGYLYTASVLQAEMIDREENLDKDRFFGLLDTVKVLCEKKLLSCTARDSALCYLYLGHGLGNKAVWEAHFGSTLSAISLGLKAKGQYQKGLKIDSTLYDLYMGIGSYHYWKSVKAGILRSAGIFKDDREKGIAELKLAIDSSLFSRNAARSALVWIYVNEKEYEKAISLSWEMLEEYPGGNFFLWPLAEAYYKSGDYENAAGVYDTLLSRLKKNPGNYYNVIEVVYYLYDCYDKLDDDTAKEETAQYYRGIHNDIPGTIRRKQRSKVSFLKRI